MVSKFKVATAYFSCSPRYINSSKLPPVVDAAKLFVFSKLRIKKSEI
jgi:hypothetical protein